MTRITDYITLVQAVKDELEDDSSEFSNYIPVAVDLAEQRLTREIDTYGLVVTTTVTTSGGSNILPKPSGYRLPFQLVQRKEDNTLNTLIKVTDEFIVEYWPNPTSVSSVVKYYADDGLENFVLAPTPASAYDVRVKYLARPSVLDNDTLTNYYTEFMSDILFYATMEEMCRFSKNYELMSLYSQKYANAIQSINNEGRRSRRDDDRANFNPKGSQNNVIEGSH